MLPINLPGLSAPKPAPELKEPCGWGEAMAAQKPLPPMPPGAEPGCAPLKAPPPLVGPLPPMKGMGPGAPEMPPAPIAQAMGLMGPEGAHPQPSLIGHPPLMALPPGAGASPAPGGLPGGFQLPKGLQLPEGFQLPEGGALAPKGPSEAPAGPSEASAGPTAAVGPSGPAEASPVDAAAPVEPSTSPSGTTGRREVQSDVIPAQAQTAIELTLGEPLREGENTIDSVPSHQDVPALNRPLSDDELSAVMDERYNGRQIRTSDGVSMAFTFENAVAASAQRLGVSNDELLTCNNAEEACHAAAANHFPQLSDSDNEVIGEGAVSRISPNVTTLTALTDLVAESQGTLDGRYAQCSDIARNAIGQTLGADGNVNAFMQAFSSKYGAGQTAADALASTAREFAPDDPQGFISQLQTNMATAFQARSDEIVQNEKAKAAPAA